jgi:hypothetical protein
MANLYMAVGRDVFKGEELTPRSSHPSSLEAERVAQFLSAQSRVAGQKAAYCETHQHYKWCEHNGGVMGPTGYEAPR